MTKSTGVGRGTNPASWNNTKRGPAHGRWNDERMLSDHGYVKVRVGKEHPLADPNGYAYEHLLVWVAAGNPRPPRGFTLHHKDEVKANNRISNLELKKRADHSRDHVAERIRDPKTGRLLPKRHDPGTLDGVRHDARPEVTHA